MRDCTKGRHRRLLRTLNEARAEEGGLRFDATLQGVARDRARSMARRDYFDHTEPDGDTAATLARKLGYGGAVGENVLYGAEEWDEAFAVWWNSAPHRENMLSPRYAAIGLAGPYDSEWSHAGDVYGCWVMVLGTTLEREAERCRTGKARLPAPCRPEDG